jgi:hypothetical protein
MVCTIFANEPSADYTDSADLGWGFARRFSSLIGDGREAAVVAE